MMSDRLKFTVSFGRTVGLPNYSSVRVDLSMEFYVDETKVEDAFTIVQAAVEQKIEQIMGEKD